MHTRWRMLGGIALAWLFVAGIAMGDATAPINGEGKFPTGSAPSDKLYVNSGSATIKATEAKKNLGAADSQITVVEGQGSGTVHVADVTNRSGESSYTVKGVYVGGGGGGGGQAKTWSADFKSTAVKVTGLTIVSGASQAGVTGATNWAAVKSANDMAIAEVSIDPDTAEAAGAVIWSQNVQTVPDKPKQRRISLANSDRITVTAKGTDNPQSSKSVDLWVVWASIVGEGAGKTISTGNDASGLAAGHKWPDFLGGGNALGEMDVTQNPNIAAYAFAIGKIQITGTLSPAGVEDVIDRSAWKFARTVTCIAWDNGGHYDQNGNWVAGPAVQKNNANDITAQGDPMRDLDPKSGNSVREIYDLDAPGCPIDGNAAVPHSAEVYANFDEWMTITLGGSAVRCSDVYPWAYESRVDTDAIRADLNTLHLGGHINQLPNAPHYPRRLP